MIAAPIEIRYSDITIELKHWHENQLIEFNMDRFFDEGKIFAIFINDIVDVRQQNEFKSLSHGMVTKFILFFIFPSYINSLLFCYHRVR